MNDDVVRSNNVSRKVIVWVLRIILLIAIILVLAPILWAVISSFKTSNDIVVNPWKFPTDPQWVNYANAWTKANIGANFVNSVMVTAISMVLMLLLVIPASYAFGRYSGKVITPLRTIFMAGLFIQKNYLVVPIFIMLRDMHLLDNRVALAVVYASFLPFSIYLLSGFMHNIDNAYVEAASIDGASHVKTMWSIVVPMCKPGIVTVAMFAFMEYWNEYILATQYLMTAEKKTLPVGLQAVMQQATFSTDWGALFASMIIVMIPIMIFYVLVQKKLTSGLSLGGVKG